MSDRIIRLREVITLTGLSRSTIYLRMANDQFPKTISLGGRAVGFIEQEVQDWIRNQIRSTRGE